MSHPSNPDPARSDTVLLSDPAASSSPSLEGSTNGTGPSRTTPFDPESSRLDVLSARYDILAEAGHGSMGNVYKARDRETGEIVALKLLKPEIASDQTMMERFKNELLFARKITHKNVCRMYDFNRIDGIAYTSMEFVEGESLRTALNRFGGLAVRKALGMALQICSGLKEAHAQGIVHRDLKPENVMIDAQGNVKIMDFGIARSMEAATRLTGSMMGTPAYMAPEQVTGKPVDYRTDVYSLGLILYEMFTGAQAFQADTPVAAAMKQIRETPALPHEVDPTIPVGIERAILKCLEKEPTKRFQSVAELEKALSAPGVTGTSPGLPVGAVLSTPTPVRAPAMTPPPARAPLKRPAIAPAHPRRTSPVLWTLLGALLVIAGLAGGHWAKIARTAKLTPAPASLPAPKPPAVALKPVQKTPVTAPEQVSSNSNAVPVPKAKSGAAPVPVAPSSSPPNPFARSKAASNKTAAAKEVFPPVERAVKKSARQIELETVPTDVQQRADKAFGEAPNPVTDPSATKFVWVGRYERKARADEVVRTIRNLGLPVRSVARQGWERRFWVVFAGPFPPKRAPDVVNWLKSQGFQGAHELRISPGSEQQGTQPE
jgi:serine/threonine protein kinase